MLIDTYNQNEKQIKNQQIQPIMVTIEAFGAIERELPDAINLVFDAELYVADVLQYVMKSYPEAAEMMDRCACAIGEDIVLRQTLITKNTTLVLLSPVAGG